MKSGQFISKQKNTHKINIFNQFLSNKNQMQLFMSSSASTQKTDPSLNDSLHIASEGVSVLGHQNPVQAAAALSDGVHRGGLYVVSTSVGM